MSSQALSYSIFSLSLCIAQTQTHSASLYYLLSFHTKHSRPNAQTLVPAHSHSHAHVNTRTPSLCHLHTLARTHTRTFTLSKSLTPMHAHSLSLSFAHTRTHTLLSHNLWKTPTCAFSYYLVNGKIFFRVKLKSKPAFIFIFIFIFKFSKKMQKQ